MARNNEVRSGPFRSDDSAAASLIDHPFIHTKFNDKAGRTKQEIQTTLRDLERVVRQTIGAKKADLPLLKLARFGADRSGGVSLRNNANMLEITGIELDFDAGDLPWDYAWVRLYQAGVVALLYTSPRFSFDKPRFRILFPTSRSLPVERRAELVAWAYGVVKGTIDPASFVDSQAYYFGTAKFVEDGVWRNGFDVRTQLVDPPDCRFIDLADDLAEGALGPDGRPFRNRSKATDSTPANAPSDEVRRVSGILSYVPGAARADWLRAGMALHDFFDGSEEGFSMWDAWSIDKSIGNYDAVDQRKTWQSFKADPFDADRSKANVRMGSLVHIARTNGWNPEQPTIESGSLRILSTWDCVQAKPPAYIWKGILGEGQIACIFGAPGAGKSLIAPYIAYMVAIGQLAFGLRTRSGGVLYIAAEDATGMQQRIAALARRHGHVSTFHVVDGVSDMLGEESPHLAALVDLIEAQRPALIVIDTLAAGFPGLEENDAKSMGKVVDVARTLTKNGAAVVLVHHDTKAEGATPRGHSILNGALDMTIHVKRGEGGIIRGTLKKNRNGTIDRDIAFQIGIEKFGEDQDGDAITAAIAEELAGAGAPRQTPLSKSQRAALTVFDRLANIGTVSEEEWMAACFDDNRVSPAPERKSRQAAFRRARNALVGANVISIAQTGNVMRSEIVSNG